MIRIILRLDDPSLTSDHALERSILNVLGELQIPATFAVVPYSQTEAGLQPLDSGRVPHLVEAHTTGLIEIAQHGYTHERLTASGPGSLSEFWGVPIEEQARRIDAGRERITAVFGIEVKGFIPPFNTYDAATASLLAERGYTYLSGSLSTPPNQAPAFRLIPRTTHISTLCQAYAEARRRPYLSTTIIVIMHHYDFQEVGSESGKLNLRAFRDTLAWLKAQPGVRFTTLGQLTSEMSINRSWTIYVRHLRKERLHWRLQRLLPRHLLYTHPLPFYL